MNSRSTPNVDPTNCLFESDWWLDAVAPGRWHVAEVRDGSKLVARMPYVTANRFGQTVITPPLLTPTLGPWYGEMDGKPLAVQKRRRKLLEKLISQLPPALSVAQAWHHSLDDWAIMKQQGFSCTCGWTYVLNELTDFDRIEAGYDGQVRKGIRKAKKSFVVTEGMPIDEFHAVNSLSFRRQGRKTPYGVDFLRRVDEAAESKGTRTIFAARTKTGRVVSAVYLVHDKRTTYLLATGTDPDFRNAEPLTLLIDHAIRYAATVSESFDFEGSMIPAVENHFCKFGGTRRPYLILRRESPVVACFRQARQIFRRRAA